MSAEIHDQRTLPQLFNEMTSEVSQLVRKEFELAKVETKQELSNATKAGALFGAAAVAGLMGLLLCSFAAAWGLAAVMPRGLAFLLIGLLYAGIAGFVFVMARTRMQHVNPVPEQTVETLKEDMQWLKAQRN